jgi:DivIVA domain-containing protein
VSWLVVLVAALLVIAVTAGAITGAIRYDPMAEPTDTVPDTGLPPEPHAGDVDEVRFDTAFRGYRMDVVDERLDALRDRLRELDRELTAPKDPS